MYASIKPASMSVRANSPNPDSRGGATDSDGAVLPAVLRAQHRVTVEFLWLMQLARQVIDPLQVVVVNEHVFHILASFSSSA